MSDRFTPDVVFRRGLEGGPVLTDPRVLIRPLDLTPPEDHDAHVRAFWRRLIDLALSHPEGPRFVDALRRGEEVHARNEELVLRHVQALLEGEP